MTKILITGSSGFLGSRLAYYLKDKYDLLLPSHGELNVSREEAVRAYMDYDEPRNLTMDCSLINEYGIYFLDSIEGMEEAIKRPFRT